MLEFSASHSSYRRKVKRGESAWFSAIDKKAVVFEVSAAKVKTKSKTVRSKVDVVFTISQYLLIGWFQQSFQWRRPDRGVRSDDRHEQSTGCDRDIRPGAALHGTG
jgi:hypothetical protein